MRRLLPDPTDHVSIEEACARDLHRPADRPWVALCMVSSIDGSTVVDERSAGLSSPVDAAVLSTLRSLADMIIVGASTVRLEGYGPPKKAGQRVGVVSRTGQVDVTRPLFSSGAGFLILPENAPQVAVDSVRAGHDDVDLRAALAQLDVDVVQAEGGAHLNGALAAADLLDEVNVTISPLLAGGSGPRVTAGAEPLALRMDLVHLLEDDGFLFPRYVRRR